MSDVFPCPDNRTPNKKSRLAVLAIFRNEAQVLEEWLQHYLALGVEHFYLIDNNSNDGYLDIVRPYVGSGCVSLFTCAKDGYQIGAYTELLPTIQEETEWIGVFDLDEFIYPAGADCFIPVLERFADYDAVLIPWLSFGSNGHIGQPDSVVDGFVMRGPADVSRSFLKAISRPREIVYFSQHNPVTRNGRKVLSNGTPFGDDSFIALKEEQVADFSLVNNHYRLQSLDYFLTVKTCRPEVHEDVKDKIKKASFFKENDSLWNQIADTRLRDLRARMKPAGAAIAGGQLEHA